MDDNLLIIKSNYDFCTLYDNYRNRKLVGNYLLIMAEVGAGGPAGMLESCRSCKCISFVKMEVQKFDNWVLLFFFENMGVAFIK